jgi:hypothetical protein
VSRFECRHEADVLDAVMTSRWPGRVEPELRAHVAGCAICRDLVLASSAFDAEAAAACAEARVPEAGLVWWRAQLRARQDAARAAVRPITVAQAVGFAVAVGAAGAVFGATATWFQQALRGLWSAVTAIRLPGLPEATPALLGTLSNYGLLIAGVAICFLLAPVVVYLAGRDE